MVLPCHLAWKWTTIPKEKQLQTQMTTTQRGPKRKVGFKKFPGWAFIEGESMWGRCVLQRVERKEKLHCHPPNRDRSQWDRNWVRVLFIHGQPSIKELFPEKHADTETHSWKQTHPSRQGDKYMHFSIPQSARHSHSNSVASRDFENKICSFYHLKYIYFSS